MAKYPYKQLGVKLDRDYRNALNDNFKNIETDLVTEKQRVDNALSEHKDRVDTLITEVEQPSEVVDSRGGFTVLRDRLDDSDEQLAQKATKTEVDALGQLKFSGTYATLTELETAYPTGSEGLYLVTADGYVYRWDGSAWVQAVQFQSTGISKKSITPEKTTFFVIGKNLFNKEAADVGYYLDGAGELVAHESYAASDFIEVEGDTQYSWSGSATRICYYDYDKVFISTISSPTSPQTTPANTVFVRYSFLKTQLDTQQFELGSTSTDYESYYGVALDIDKIKDGSIPSDKLVAFSEVAKTGDYNDLINKPTFDSKTGKIYYNANFTNGIIDIYAPSNDGTSSYMHYQLKHEVLPYTDGGDYQNYDGWRLYKLFTCTYNDGIFTDEMEIVNAGAWECAISVDGLSDFHGTYHGYEKQSSINFLVNNIENMTDSNGWVDSVTFTQVSQLIKHATESEAISDCGRKYVFSKNGFVLTQTLDWLQALTIDRSYTTMLPIKRHLNADGTGLQITDRVISDADNVTYDISLSGHDTPISNIDYSKPKNVREVLLYGKDSNIFANVKILDNKNSNGARMSVSKDSTYNKVYYINVPRNHATTVGEHWYTKTHYQIGMN